MAQGCAFFQGDTMLENNDAINKAVLSMVEQLYDIDELIQFILALDSRQKDCDFTIALRDKLNQSLTEDKCE